MKNIILALTFTLFGFTANTQIKNTLIEKFTSKIIVTTEFSDSADANKQVLENTQKYNWLHDGVFKFKKDGLFELKLKNGKTEKGRYTAQDSRVILIFDNEEIEEFNTTKPRIEDNKIILPFGRQMTKVNLELNK
jgi:hypothetical protein